jgi:cell division septum initiation protein DivIVA
MVSRRAQVDELQQRVAELEEELDETRQNLDTASSIGQQMVERLQQVEEENEELREGNMAPDAIHDSEMVNPACTRTTPSPGTHAADILALAVRRPT